MGVFLPQIILAARRYDEDSGWIQLLVFVIMAVFWALSTIVKSRSKKKGDLDEDEQPEEAFSEYEQQISQQTRPQQKKTAQPGQTARYAATKKETFAGHETLKSLEAEKMSSSEQLQPQTGIDFPLDLEGTDNLKRAVVYYEVFGKPLAMRDEPRAK